MELLHALKTRRSIAQLKPDSVPRELIEQLLEMATRAPNHKKTEPWKFFVFGGESRHKLADAFVENYNLDHPAASKEELAGPGHKSANRVLSSPLVIVVTSDSGNNEVQTLENYGAVCAATQNILLAAHALGLSGFWRTGDAAYTAPRNAIKELIGVSESTQLAAFLLIGFPVVTEKNSPRLPFQEKTVWFDENSIQSSA